MLNTYYFAEHSDFLLKYAYAEKKKKNFINCFTDLNLLSCHPLICAKESKIHKGNTDTSLTCFFLDFLINVTLRL